MTRPPFGPAADVRELDDAYSLEARVFGPDAESARRRRDANERLEPPVPEDAIVARKRGRVVGLVRLVRRTISLAGENLSAGGVTNVCVDPDLRGQGVGRRLMEASVSELARRGFALSATIARRAADGFYPLFGYLGIAAFAEMRLTVGGAAPPGLKRSNGPRDLRGAAAAYAASYGSQALTFRRDAAWWRALPLRLKLKHPGLRWSDLTRRGRVIGYVLDGPAGVVEAASSARDAAECSDALISELFGKGERLLRLSPAHPWSEALNNRNHTALIRAAWDGGHLVRVLDPKRVFGAIARAARRDGADRTSLAALARLSALRPGDAAAVREALAHASGICQRGPACRLPRVILPWPLRPAWGPLDEF